VPAGFSSCPGRPYSPFVVEEGFCELRMWGVLRSSPKSLQKIVHLSDPLAPLEE
jgi:hypothetical protein